MRSRACFLVLVLLASIAAASPGIARADDNPPPAPPCDPMTQSCNQDGTICNGPFPFCPPPGIVIKNESYMLPLAHGNAAKAKSTYIDPVYSAVIQKLSNVPTAQARCWDSNSWQILSIYFGGQPDIGLEGYVLPVLTQDFDLGINALPNNKANYAPDVCARLDVLSAQKKRPSTPEGVRLMALAVNVLAHEAMHVRGFLAEDEAQCRSMQLIVKTAQLLGMNTSYGQRLANYAYHYIYPSMPETYQSPLRTSNGPWVEAGGYWPKG